MDRTLLEMAVELVLSQSEQRLMLGEDLDQLLKQTYRSLKEIQAAESGGGGDLGNVETSREAFEESERVQFRVGDSRSSFVLNIDPMDSIKDDKIICMECGKSLRQLTPMHLEKHNLTASDYRKKYGFRRSQPLAARASTEKRKSIAKQLGTGKRLLMAREAKKSSQ